MSKTHQMSETPTPGEFIMLRYGKDMSTAEDLPVYFEDDNHEKVYFANGAGQVDWEAIKRECFCWYYLSEALDPWTSVEDGLPEGDVKMDWLVKEISAHPNYQRVERLKIIRQITGDQLAKRQELMADEWFEEAYYQPITEPTHE